mgnify:FL=1
MPDHPEPRYRPELNEGLGGSIEFGDEYLFPVDLPAENVREILEDQSTGETEVRGSTFPYFSVYLGGGQRADLLHSHGDSRPVDAVAVYDEKQDETLGFYDIRDLKEEQREI